MTTDDVPIIETAPETSSESATSPRAPAWQLAVLRGLHTGARVPLAAEDWMLIGAAEDCDVVLRDRGVLPHHAALCVRGERWQVRAIDGPVHAGGDEIPAGANAMLDDGGVWELAGVALGVGSAEAPAWAALAEPESAQGDAVMAAAAAASLDGDGSGESVSTDDAAPAPAAAPLAAAPRRRFSPSRKIVQAAVLGVACVAVLGTGAAATHSLWQKVQVREAGTRVSSLLGTLNLPELRAVESAQGQLRVEGTVRDEAERARLLAELQQRGLFPVLDVVSGEQLAAVVQNSLRQHGLRADARYAGAGRVEVRGVATSPTAEQAVKDVLVTNKSINHIAFLDAPSEAAAAPAAQDDAAQSAAAPQTAQDTRDPLRVVGVVGGLVPYVVTQDRRRWHVGAVLPNGTQIDHIEGHAVDFSRNGRATRVQF
jgi:type III secretion system YscD/HrpQ family protein